MPDNLFQYIRTRIPIGFIADLARRQPQVYAEAAATAYEDPRWTEAEGRSLIGHLERAIFENMTRNAAKAHGMIPNDKDHHGENCSCVHVYSDNLALTTHRVPEPGHFVRQCASRKQDAAVNKFLDGYLLDGSLCAPLPQLKGAERIRLYILHGARVNANNEKELFIQLAAPDAELNGYQWICSFSELQQAYLEDSRTNVDQTDNMPAKKPTLRKIKKTSEGKG